jgi:drug/metabolite transporter (DMT)-like permease
MTIILLRCLPVGRRLSMKSAAILLILIGIGIVIWGAFGFQTREKVLDVGPIHASRDKEHNVPYGPLAGGLLAVGGVVLLLKGKE